MLSIFKRIRALWRISELYIETDQVHTTYNKYFPDLNPKSTEHKMAQIIKMNDPLKKVLEE